MKMRIATVKATGERYLVQSMSIPKSGEEARVHCWGDVVAVKAARARTFEEALDKPTSTRHEASRTFLRSAVDISDEIVVTYLLALELLAQTSSKTGRSVSSSRRRAR